MMEFESIDADEDVLNILEQVERRAPPAPSSSDSPSPNATPVTNTTVSIPSSQLLPSLSGGKRWVPNARASQPLPASNHAEESSSPSSLAKNNVSGCDSINIALSYGGKARIRVTISGSRPKFAWSTQNRPQETEGPLITQSNLPIFISEVFQSMTVGQNISTWDVPCTDPTWPVYEEKQINLASKTPSILAHWIFPARLLPQLDLKLTRAVEAESQRQLSNSFQNRIRVTYTSLPEYVRRLILECTRIFRDAERMMISSPATPLPSDPKITSILPPHLLERPLFQTLHPYQLKGVEYAYCRNGRVLIADAPGLGKTLQALAIAQCYEQDWPVLVICPSSVRGMWANEFQRWTPNLDVTDISANFSGSKTTLKARVNVISYELLKSPAIIASVWQRDPATGTQSHPFGIVICDECQLLKTYRSARCQAILPLVQKSKRAILLSGTPATSRPKELHTQLSCLHPSLFQYFPAFGDRYCDPHPNHFSGGFDYSGASNLHELHLLLTEALMIRRLKEEVLGNMPLKRRHQILLEIPKAQRKYLIAMAKEMRSLNELRSSSGKKSAKATSSVQDSDDEDAQSPFQLAPGSIRGRSKQIVLEMFANAGRAKLPSAIAHLKQCMQDSPPETKFLVFAHHLDILDGFSHAMREDGIEYIRIDGKTVNTTRQLLVDHFQQTDACRVAILSILAAGVGITLTRASKVFFAELFWDPAALLQAEDRAHRIGQNQNVDIFYMIAKDSYDERLWNVIDSKLSVLSAVLDARKSQMNVDFVTRASAKTVSLHHASNDSFINYILQKMEGYEQRAEEAIERAEIRRKVRDQALDLDEDTDGLVDSASTPKDHRKVSKGAKTATKRDRGETALKGALKRALSTTKATSSQNIIHLSDSDEEDTFQEPPLKKNKAAETALSEDSITIAQPAPAKLTIEELKKRREEKMKRFMVC